MGSIATVIQLAELAGLAWIVWRVIQTLKSGDVTDLPGAQWIADYFEGVAWEVIVPAGKNSDVVDYCYSHGMTAQGVADAIEAGLPLIHPRAYTVGGIGVPGAKTCGFPDGFAVLSHFYMNLKESQVFGSGGGLFGLGTDDLLWDSLEYVTWKEWATEQLEAYTRFATHFGFEVDR